MKSLDLSDNSNTGWLPRWPPKKLIIVAVLIAFSVFDVQRKLFVDTGVKAAFNDNAEEFDLTVRAMLTEAKHTDYLNKLASFGSLDSAPAEADLKQGSSGVVNVTEQDLDVSRTIRLLGIASNSDRFAIVSVGDHSDPSSVRRVTLGDSVSDFSVKYLDDYSLGVEDSRGEGMVFDLFSPSEGLTVK